MIRVNGLTKDYGNRRAISGINFTIKKGEIVGFLGPNGAGKTTTMRILAGYLPPTAGEVTIGGFDILEQSLDVRRIVGYMPETVPLYGDMTVHEYLLYMASLRHVENAEERVDEILEKLHMEKRAAGYIGKLSKGMRQRIGLAQALLHKPEVLILDEPTIGLDPAQIIEVRNMIREVGKEHTVLLSTHILPEVEQVCDRVLIINKGQLVAEDTTEHLQARLTGTTRVYIKVRGEIEEAVPVVASTPGVVGVQTRDADSLEFEISAGNDSRPDVAKNVISAGFDLLELRPVSMSLEEIFLQLTREDPLIVNEGETPEISDESERD